MRGMRLRVLIALLTLAAMVLVGACAPRPAAQPPAGEAPDQADAGPQFGGTLRIAWEGEPSGLDFQRTTAHVVRRISWHVFETLFTFDQNLQVIPMLADSYTVNADATVWRIKLREGVRFHNGKVMTSEDVVASLERWGQVAGVGLMFGRLEALVAVDNHTVELRFKQPFGLVPAYLATTRGGAAIYPAEIARAAGKDEIPEYIGTGPYKFVEWRRGQFIRLERFDDYTARPEPPDGYGGQRVAYFDRIDFVFVPDVSVRMAAIEAGEYDFAKFALGDEYARYENHPTVEPVVVKGANQAVNTFNFRSPIMSDVRIRQAFLAALDMDPLLEVAFGHPAVYRKDCGILVQESGWWSDAGCESYDQNNPEKARRLLQEAGYKGEPIRWLTTRTYEYLYKVAVASKPQLEAVGFNIDLQVMDWATLTQKRFEPDAWEVFQSGWTYVEHPILHIRLSSEWAGWWDSPEKNALVGQLVEAPTFEEQYAIWKKMHLLWYTDVPQVKVGDEHLFHLRSKALKGYQALPEDFFWNTWLDTK